ncbi:MAG TPA: PEP-CTERM sorting domain-containing protein [Fimbriimonadaceae bacterium]|nr:PEP-CTERM sorting domain-containing protein [Fimbriimonadaceae bacterium]
MRIAALALVLGLARFTYSQQYSAVDIRQVVSDSFRATALAEDGSLGGYIITGTSSQRRAATFLGGVLSTYSGLGGEFSRGLDLTPNGRLIGLSYTNFDDPTGVFWDESGNASRLPLLNGGSYAYAIWGTVDSQMAGFADTIDNRQELYLTDGETAVGVGWPTEDYFVEIVDFAGGLFIGNLYNWGEGGRAGAFIYDVASRESRLITDQNIELNDVNDRGQIVGWRSRFLGDPFHGFLIEGSDETILGSEFYPRQLNNMDLILGSSINDSRPGLFRNGAWASADELSFGTALSVETLTRVNDQGQIQGRASSGSYVTQVLLTPVPEPSAFVAFGLGVALLTWKRKGKVVSL